MRLSPKPSDQNSAKSATASPAGNASAPSVPLSLYREVASELQSMQTSLAHAQTENQSLVEQNQKLRLEIERVVQTALHLRQVADDYRQIPEAPTPSHSDHPELTEATLPLSAPAPAAVPKAASGRRAKAKPKTFTGQPTRPQGPDQSESSGELSVWWLIVVILLIVTAFFGLGFVVLNTLMPRNSQ